MDTIRVYCADLGAIRPEETAFGWAGAEVRVRRPTPQLWNSGTDISELADSVASDLEKRRAVALGFEAPLFYPVPIDRTAFHRARPNEGNRSWSVRAGLQALRLALVQVPWLLEAIQSRTTVRRCFVDWPAFCRAGGGLFLWEAFVSGPGKKVAEGGASPHVEDAKTAVELFAAALPQPKTAIGGTERPFSLIASAALWSGWAVEPEMLTYDCLVLKAVPEETV